MAVQPSDVVAQMRDTLALSDPDLDTTVGTTTRKILDAVGEVVAEAYADRYLGGYSYDIDVKSGDDLDEMVNLFGFTRLPAKRATGSITFERSGSATGDILIPRGTQIATDDVLPVVVSTLVPATMMRGDTSLTIPAQATVGGTAGNVPADVLNRVITPLQGVGTVTNQVAFTGGSDAESDEQLRTRFKATIFRNLAGTEQMFLATALEDPNVTQVNVIGASKIHREQIEIVSGEATSTLVGAKYIYPDSAVLGEDIDAGHILTPGVHFDFNPLNQKVSIIDDLAEDGIYDLEFEYVPQASRNDPTQGVTNRVDIYVKGERPTEAEEIAVFRTARVFDNTTTSPLYYANFERVSDSSPPQVGNYFIDLSFGPVMDVSTSDEIVIDGVTYTEGVHYFAVTDVTSTGGTSTGLSGIEFVSAGNGNGLAIPSDKETFLVTYAYNGVPGAVETAARSWRLVTTDVRVHTAHLFRLQINLVVVLDPGYPLSSVQPSINAALSAYLDSVGFAGVVQVSDILEAVMSVEGVDAARMTTSADDPTDYATQRVNSEGDVLDTFDDGGSPARAVDVFLDDMQVPVFNSTNVIVRSRGTFGAV